MTFDGLVGICGTRSLAAEIRERIAGDVAASIDRQRATVARIAKVLGIEAATD